MLIQLQDVEKLRIQVCVHFYDMLYISKPILRKSHFEVQPYALHVNPIDRIQKTAGQY